MFARSSPILVLQHADLSATCQNSHTSLPQLQLHNHPENSTNTTHQQHSFHSPQLLPCSFWSFSAMVRLLLDTSTMGPTEHIHGKTFSTCPSTCHHQDPSQEPLQLAGARSCVALPDCWRILPSQSALPNSSVPAMKVHLDIMISFKCGVLQQGKCLRACTAIQLGCRDTFVPYSRPT